MNDPLDRWISEGIHQKIDSRYYTKISEQAKFNRLARDPQFLADPGEHVGLYSDHSIIHARDVANRGLEVLNNCHGVLIPRRDQQRLAMMQGYSVLLAYFHDIGMIDFSRFGRIMHPEFAAQAVFDPDNDDLITAIWRENSGGLAWHLRSLAEDGLLSQEPIMVMREMLALSIAHSKSKVPMDLLNNPARLRSHLIEVITSDLHALYADLQQPGQNESGKRNEAIGRFAHFFPDQAFLWLVDDRPAVQEFAQDVIDTLRVLRAADALRQRGTVLKTSGGDQIFLDLARGTTVFALRLGEDRIYLLEITDTIRSGESNIASSELEPSGDLRISFHRGTFSAPGAMEHAARSAAFVVYDIVRDVIRSFVRSSPIPGLKQAADMQLRLEETEDNLAFPHSIRAELNELDPNVARQVRITPSLKYASDLERARYLASKPFDWGLQDCRELLARVGQSGYPVERIDEQKAFKDVRLLELDPGEVLIEEGTPSYFVYLPLGPGLKVIPLGGYDSFSVQPWMFLGITGVVRGAERSARIVAERRLQVLMIPKTPYLAYWHHTLSVEQLQNAVAGAMSGTSTPELFSQLEKRILLQDVPLFKTLDQSALVELATRVLEVQVPAGRRVFDKGAIGRSMFVVVEGTLQAHDDDLVFHQFDRGDVFGEMAAITAEPRSASVTAITDSCLLRLDQEDLNHLIATNPNVARGIIEVLVSIIRHRTEFAAQQPPES